MPIPNNIQAALLIKVLKFSPQIADKSPIRILIVYNNASRLAKDELVAELEKTQSVKAVNADELEQQIKNCDVVYFMPGLQDKSKICKANKVLSISGVSKYVEDGDISVAFGLMNDKPKIYVNVSTLKSEEQNLSSDLLRIAKVYK